MAFRLHRKINISELTVDNKNWLIDEIKAGRTTSQYVLEHSNINKKTLMGWLKKGEVKEAGRPAFITPEACRIVMDKMASSTTAIRSDAFRDIVNEAVKIAAGGNLVNPIDGPSKSTLKRFMNDKEIVPAKAEVTTTARIKATSEIRNQVSWAAVFEYISKKKKVINSKYHANYISELFIHIYTSGETLGPREL
jgi:hypothetical protein